MPLSEGDIEEWRSIRGYEGRYSVSNLGRVKSLERVEFVPPGRHPNPVYRRRAERVLKEMVGSVGYPVVTLYHHDLPTRPKLVHRLVAESFLIRDHPSFKEVNHKDGNKLNNNVDNLEWCTRSQNALHSTRVLEKNRGEDNASSKLTEDKVLAIKELILSGKTQTEIAPIFGVTNHAIYRIQHGYNWAWLTGFGKEEEL